MGFLIRILISIIMSIVTFFSGPFDDIGIDGSPSEYNIPAMAAASSIGYSTIEPVDVTAQYENAPEQRPYLQEGQQTPLAAAPGDSLELRVVLPQTLEPKFWSQEEERFISYSCYRLENGSLSGEVSLKGKTETVRYYELNLVLDLPNEEGQYLLCAFVHYSNGRRYQYTIELNVGAQKSEVQLENNESPHRLPAGPDEGGSASVFSGTVIGQTPKEDGATLFLVYGSPDDAQEKIYVNRLVDRNTACEPASPALGDVIRAQIDSSHHSETANTWRVSAVTVEATGTSQPHG